MPITSGPFYQPGTYGGTWNEMYPNWEQSDLWYTATNIDREAAWTRYLTKRGYGGLSDRDAFARSLLGRADEGYGAASLENPELNWWDYLKNNFDIDSAVLSASPNQRGERNARYAPPSRWTSRVY